MTQNNKLDRASIEAQLARIINSRQFCNSPRLSRFLNYVVQERLAGRVDRLKGYAIGLEVFDKPDDFDPQTDTIVRVQARALRQKLDQYYTQDGRFDPVQIIISKGSYEPEFVASVDVSEPSSSEPDVASVSSEKPSIAVLPFDDFSQNDSPAYLSRGLTEEIIANLSRFRELSVFSRTTLEKAKSDKLTIPQIYKVFRPDFVLEGSFRCTGDKTDLTINLVDAAADSIILSEHFSHGQSPDAPYGMQDEIAAQVASRIADRFGPLWQYGRSALRTEQSSKWRTYGLISRYHQHSVQLSLADRQVIKDGLIQGLENDPKSSDAHAVLALIALDEYRMSFAERSDRDLLELALTEAEKAVSCDSENAIAHEALAVAYFHRREFSGFESASSRALTLNTGHPDMLAMLGLCNVARANWDVGLPLLEKAITLNPHQVSWYHIGRALGLAMTVGAAAAIDEIQKAPLEGAFFYHCYLVWFLVEADDLDEARREKEKLLNVLPEFETLIFGHFRAWCLDPEIADRAISAWSTIGLNVLQDEPRP